MANKVHYQTINHLKQPAANCAPWEENRTLTTNIKKVTCKKCLKELAPASVETLLPLKDAKKIVTDYYAIRPLIRQTLLAHVRNRAEEKKNRNLYSPSERRKMFSFPNDLREDRLIEMFERTN